MTNVSKARVLITLRPEILDVQGQAVETSLKALGFSDLKSVRIGKIVEIETASPMTTEKMKQIEQMSKELLANPIIEDFKVEGL